MQYIHVADHKNFPESTKIDRVSKYFSELQKNFLTQAVCVGKECDVDERMIEYFGKYGSFLKQ